jgi:hypothetical protein
MVLTLLFPSELLSNDGKELSIPYSFQGIFQAIVLLISTTFQWIGGMKAKLSDILPLNLAFLF